MQPSLGSCEPYSALTASQDPDLGCCGHEDWGLFGHWSQAGPCHPALGRLEPLPHPQPLWRPIQRERPIYFMDLVAASQNAMVMGAIEMRRTNFYWLVSSFQGPSPSTPRPLEKLHRNSPHTYSQSSQVSSLSRKGGRAPVMGANEVRKTSSVSPSQSSPCLPSSLPLSTAIVFKPNNYSNSNNNHHLLALFF